MSALSVALAHARQRARLAQRLRREAKQAWARVDRAAISQSWARLMPELLGAIVAGQRAAASSADMYLTDVLTAQDLSSPPAGLVNVDALTGVASDGRNLMSLLAIPAIVAKTAIGSGHSLDEAMATGGALAQLLAHTQVADAGRVADGVALAARTRAGGYTRMVVGATCSRCIILAGRWYRWNAGFNRHPKCDCVGIPCSEDSADDFRTDPRKTFDSMSGAEQDKVFGKAGAESIRLGADMSQVVNARRGVQTAQVFGRQVLVTTEGTTSRGLAGRRLAASGVPGGARLMPETILADATSREDAIRILRRFGYIR